MNPGRHERAVRIDDALTVGREPGADLGDQPVADPHVGRSRRRAGAVDQRPAAYQEISRHAGDDAIRVASESSAARKPPPEVAGEGAGEGGRVDQEVVEVGGVDLPGGQGRARLHPAAVGVAAEHVDVTDDGAGGDRADRLALHDHLGLPVGQEEGGGGHRALVEEAVAGLQLAERGPPRGCGRGRRPRRLPRKSAGCASGARPRRRVDAVPVGSVITVIAPPLLLAPRRAPTGTLYILCIALYILSC